jgi:hypothetical protein
MRASGKWVMIGLGCGLVGVGLDYFVLRRLSDGQQIWAFIAITLIAMFTVFLLDKRKNSSKTDRN